MTDKIWLWSAVCALLLFLPMTVSAATLELNPPAGSYVAGDSIAVDVLVDTAGRAINAVSADIAFDQDLLEARSISRSNSIIDLWIEEPSVVGVGNVVLEGLILNPGFTGRGRVVTIHFLVKNEGSATVSFDTGLVLANDGYGTNVVERFDDALFTLLPAGDTTGPAATLPSIDELADAEEGEGLLPPAVISYTQDVRTLNDLMIRGVTYPNVQVNVYLQPEEGEVAGFKTVSDAGGNFVYNHGRDADRNFLLTANVFSILDALAQHRTTETYDFWLTAVRNSIESQSTQQFSVFISSGVTPLLIASLVLLAVAVLLTVYMLYSKHKHDRAVVAELKKDIDSISYDIEKYGAKGRQDTQGQRVVIE